MTVSPPLSTPPNADCWRPYRRMEAPPPPLQLVLHRLRLQLTEALLRASEYATDPRALALAREIENKLTEAIAFAEQYEKPDKE